MAGIVLAAYLSAPTKAAAGRILARWESVLEPVLRFSQPDRAPSWQSILDDADAKDSTIYTSTQTTHEPFSYE